MQFIASLPCWVLLTILFLLSIVPFDIGILKDAHPMFLLIGVFYWSLFRPDFISNIVLFVLGLWHDAILDNPLGMTALILIATSVTTIRQRKLLLHQPFWILWGVFGFVALTAGFFIFLLNMIFLSGFVPVIPYFLDIGLSFILFPLLVVFLKMTNPPLALHLTKK